MRFNRNKWQKNSEIIMSCLNYDITILKTQNFMRYVVLGSTELYDVYLANESNLRNIILQSLLKLW